MPAKSMSRPRDGRSEPMRASQSSAAVHRGAGLGAEYGRGRAMGLARRRWSRDCLRAQSTDSRRRVARRRGNDARVPGRDGLLPRLFDARRHDGEKQSRHARRALRGARGIRVHESIRLEKPLDEVYAILAASREPAAVHDPSRSASTTSATAARTGSRRVRPGTAVEWDAEIINEVENKVIGWRSLPGADVVTAGSVNFDSVRGGSEHAAVRCTCNTRRRPAGPARAGQALRPRTVADHPRGSAALQAAARGGRDAGRTGDPLPIREPKRSHA